MQVMKQLKSQQSHHYWMPYTIYINEQVLENKIRLREDVPYFSILSQWHFIQFEYGLDKKGQRSQFKISYFDNQDLKSKQYYLGNSQYYSLFINTKFYAYFGGDFTIYQKLKGQLAGFYFISNYPHDLDFLIFCHYSCKTCNGPQISDCLSCHDNNERVYLEDIQQCVCPI
ncbi:unnamed protein product [Paramecium pentaurelia]|uniref:Uncharacterized protein n=1 Tax=Paramecium pentaurelia TaxID=43138 RepID=A0A8S1XAS7_9CILI|nr:unnamed protein product [Paramecium pentaurelia]